ncbi:MAG: DNA-binding response regulator, partial [Candidatus Electrothrix sp. AR4]|nr:DNA-binding response regulator [Candidatus Electrothrix sp. AR4]
TPLDFLPARISAMFRTVEALRSNDTESKIIEHQDLRIDEDRKEVYWQGKAISLTLTEFWILVCLAKRPGHVKNHEQLMQAASVIVTNNAIAAHIRRIRDKFQEVDQTFKAIRSEYGMGYRWHP